MFIKYQNRSGYGLPNWVKNCNEKNNYGKLKKFTKSTRMKSPTSHSEAMRFPPIVISFMYIETIQNTHGSDSVFVSFERTDNVQITIMTFFYNKLSTEIDGFLKEMWRFTIRYLVADNTWSTRYNISQNDRYIDSSIKRTKSGLNCTVENYGIKLICNPMDRLHANVCFSNVTVKHSV